MALTALREASVLKPDSDLILRNLSDAYAAAHLIPDSNAVARQVLHLKPENADTLNWYADQMQKNGEFPGSVSRHCRLRRAWIRKIPNCF